MRNIKEIHNEMAALRAEYERKIQELETEIAAVRTARGTVLKQPDWTNHYEEGRDAPRDNRMGGL